MEIIQRVCQSAYGTYIRGVTTVSARYIGHPAVAIPASEMIKTMMGKNAPPVSRPFVTITNEQMNSLKIEERRGEKEYLKTKDTREKRERLPFSQPIRDMGLLWNRMWGYEDDAPVAGQPFYDIVELYGDFKRATNDFSDYLEKEINDWAKGLDEDYKNRELAKPASMRSDFGDAVTGLTSGKEDNLSFGGKVGAFSRGLLVDGCGKLLIKDTLLAASSPCDTAKGIMAAVKAAGDMDEEDFSRIAKEIKTTWDEASEGEKLNYAGQAGAIVADFLIAKKLKLSKQAEVAKIASKADDIAEAGAKANSKADDVAEAGTKVTSKVDDVAEAGTKAGSKADDIAEAGTKVTSKADDITEAGAKASSKAKATGQATARTVVQENSGANGSGVKISGEKPKTDIDGIKTTGTESKADIDDITKKKANDGNVTPEATIQVNAEMLVREIQEIRGTVVDGKSAFERNLEAKLTNYGISLEEFNTLRVKDVTTLTEMEKQILIKLREISPDPTSDTLLQKIVPASEIENYLTGKYNTIGGFITRFEDVAHLQTYEDIFDSLRLNYDGSAFKPETDTFMGAIRFKTNEVSKILVPYAKEMDGFSEGKDPFTGNGFTKSKNGTIIPEFKCEEKQYLEILDGAQIVQIDRDGIEKILAIYHYNKETQKGRFVPVK